MHIDELMTEWYQGKYYLANWGTDASSYYSLPNYAVWVEDPGQSYAGFPWETKANAAYSLSKGIQYSSFTPQTTPSSFAYNKRVQKYMSRI